MKRLPESNSRLATSQYIAILYGLIAGLFAAGLCYILVRKPKDIDLFDAGHGFF